MAARATIISANIHHGVQMTNQQPDTFTIHFIHLGVRINLEDAPLWDRVKICWQILWNKQMNTENVFEHDLELQRSDSYELFQAFAFFHTGAHF